jgi:hypothetical protein
MNITDIPPPTISTNVIVSTREVEPESDDDYMICSGGSICMNPEYPTKEQEEQEKKVRAQLFVTRDEKIAAINAVYSAKMELAKQAYIQTHGIETYRLWNTPKPEEDKLRKQWEEEINQARLEELKESFIFKSLEECPITNPAPEMPMYNPDIQSILEEEQINIQAIRSATIHEVLQSSMFTNNDGFTAMNDEQQTDGWDSMFQEPLQPFSFNK